MTKCFRTTQKGRQDTKGNNFLQLSDKRSACHSCTCLPDAGELAHFNVPAHGNALGSDDVEALGVGADLAGIQCLAHRCGQLCLLHITLHMQTCFMISSSASHVAQVLSVVTC